MEKIGVYHSLDHLKSQIVQCNECCNGGYMSYHCPLCPVWKYKPRNKGKVEDHMMVHWKTGVEGPNGNDILNS